MKTAPEISQFDFGKDDVAWGVELPIPPFGAVPIFAEDISDNSRRILEELIRSWNSLWPEMLEWLQERMNAYEVEQELGKDDFLGSISRMDSDCYMGDQSDFHLRLEFDEPPLWDFFLKGSRIVHSQPVF